MNPNRILVESEMAALHHFHVEALHEDREGIPASELARRVNHIAALTLANKFPERLNLFLHLARFHGNSFREMVRTATKAEMQSKEAAP